MPYIPHTDADVQAMLEAIGVDSIDALFDEIPADILSQPLSQVPEGASEMEVTRLMSDRAAADSNVACYIGAGAYEHHIPAAVWEIVGRGEFMTAYTPYQAEASQGTLQVIYEYQSMMAHLNAMDVSNASLYDGGSAMAEAVLMAIRANRKSKSKKVLVPSSVNPLYRSATNAIVENQGIEIEEVMYCSNTGTTPLSALQHYVGEDYAALIIQQPNFFGCLEDVHALTNWAHEQKMLVVAVVNPTSLAILTPPGEWGETGADIAVGEGQPLGIPLSSGGPYFGFMCCKQGIVRQMPGRIIGRTVDLEGKPGFALTLQAREQHIRRSKATSNICTNQGLAMTAATIYTSLLGADGLAAVANASVSNTQKLVELLTSIEGVEKVFTAPTFHEAVIRVPGNAAEVLTRLAEQRIQGGFALASAYEGMDDAIVVCATETKTDADLQSYKAALAAVLSA
ncbi:MAG: aminomethyl-transferring glycine dehydrogenase [Gammaproteobacteria bacterium]|nr:MAG: aminomethyl-transferring glycine dehydrogenase [Gammaproteobacteria bacterium]